MQQADEFELACSPSLVDAFQHVSMTKSVRRTAVVVGELWWRLKERILVDEMLCTDCISRRSGVPFVLLFHLSVHAFEKDKDRGIVTCHCGRDHSHKKERCDYLICVLETFQSLSPNLIIHSNGSYRSSSKLVFALEARQAETLPTPMEISPLCVAPNDLQILTALFDSPGLRQCLFSRETSAPALTHSLTEHFSRCAPLFEQFRKLLVWIQGIFICFRGFKVE